MSNKHMAGWEVEEEVAEVKLGRKTYKNMARVSRPCQTCNARFSIWVTQKTVEGKSANDSLRLRNCEKHRRMAKAGLPPEEASEFETLRAMWHGIQSIAKFKPYGARTPAMLPTVIAELVDDYEATMKENNEYMKEAAELNRQLGELRQENAALKATATKSGVLPLNMPWS